MKWTNTKTTVIVGIAILAVVAVTMVVKPQPVKDSYFKPDFDNLRHVPSGIVAVRPTHSTESIGDPIRNMFEKDSLVRAVGCNVTLRDLIAEAYGCEPGLVVLPPDASKSGFDFLVTVPTETQKHLQSAIGKKLGYVARQELRDMEVLKLKVKDATLPGLTASPGGESETIQYKDGKLYFRHKTLKLLMEGLQDGLARPVLDETGLTGRYNFSVAWSEAAQERMRGSEFDLDGVQKVLNSLGLELETATEPMNVFVVKKTL